MKANKYSKLIISILLISFSTSGYSQTTNPFEIMFDNKSDKITNDNIDNIYELILNIYTTLNDKNITKSNYLVKYESVIQENIRKKEVDDILNSMNKNLKYVTENKENSLNISTTFESSNIGEIDLNDYQIKIIKSDIKIGILKSLSTLGKFDYSNLKTSEPIKSELSYNIKLSDNIISNFKLDLLLKAFTHFEYRIVSEKDVNSEFSLGADKYKLIDIKKNYIALETSNIDDIDIYTYKGGMVSKSNERLTFPIYKSLYEYYTLNKNLNLEKLRKDFPLEKLQNLNKFGYYSIIISTNAIEHEVLISKKEFKTLTTQIKN